jgi:hypothetical protein
LPSTLVHSVENDTFRYKQDLLKRKNDEEIAEEWIECGKCDIGVHAVCAMHNGFVHDSTDFVCPECLSNDDLSLNVDCTENKYDSGYTFVSGSDEPVPISSVRKSSIDPLDSDSLAQCRISRFIQEKVHDVMKDFPNASKTITVRIISDCFREFSVPSVIKRYFRMKNQSDHVVEPPPSVHYRQKAIAMFQKIDGLDVCVFCMYVQEYDGDDDGPNQKRVYIAYIDSVEHFRPRELRTQVFHEILIAYLATARERGYKKAHIWACPPSRGNCFVFWNHPASQRTPTADRLEGWYHGMVSRAIDFGVVTDVKSLYETDFEQPLAELSNNPRSSLEERMICPPLIDGDFWLEEAVRIHQTAVDRHLKVRSPTEVCVWNLGSPLSGNYDSCPALQVAALLKDRVMTHPSSVPFRRPVNAAAMKLKDYHEIVKKPVDLGTIYARCYLGEYKKLMDVVQDVKLMVSNAKLFNPPGHIVNSMAAEVLDLFYDELNVLTKMWKSDETTSGCWESRAHTSMSLNVTIEVQTSETQTPLPLPLKSVVVEDDGSADGTRSMSSSDCPPPSPKRLRDSDTIGVVGTTKTTNSLPNETQNASLAHKLEASTYDKNTPLKILDILVDGPDAVLQRMAGNDVWLLDKRSPTAAKISKNINKKKRRQSSVGSSEEGSETSSKRRQSWLCKEVGQSIRRLRTSFFSCSLSPYDGMGHTKHKKLEDYESYIGSFRQDSTSDKDVIMPSLADTRSALLELSQFRNFEFDTLRRAKYSTRMLLYHIRKSNVPGTVPLCSSCGETVTEVRWHKVKKIRQTTKPTTAGPGASKKATQESPIQDLCSSCLSNTKRQDDLIPIPVSTRTVENRK